MKQIFLPTIGKALFEELVQQQRWDELYDQLAQPLHERLYQRQTFDFFDELTEGQRLLIGFDYLTTQCTQGGFIQFLFNGYVSLLPDMVLTFQAWGMDDIALVLDDVLKVYVLNRQFFKADGTVQDLARLYDELLEFEELDKRFEALKAQTIRQIMQFAATHKDEFAQLGL